MFSKGNTVVILSACYGSIDEEPGEIDVNVAYGIVKTWSKECYIDLLSPDYYGKTKLHGYPRDNGIIYGWTIVRPLPDTQEELEVYIQEEVDKARLQYIESVDSEDAIVDLQSSHPDYYFARRGNIIRVEAGESVPDMYELRNQYIEDIKNAPVVVRHFLDIPFESIKRNTTIVGKSKNITTEYIKDYLEAADWGTGYKRTSKKNINGKVVRTFENKLYKISVITDSNDEEIEAVCPLSMKNPDGSINTTMNMFNYNIFYNDEFGCNLLMVAADHEVAIDRIDGVWGYEDNGFIPEYNTKTMEKILQHISDRFSDVIGADGEIVDTCEYHIVAIKDEYVDTVHKLLTEPAIAVKLNLSINFGEGDVTEISDSDDSEISTNGVTLVTCYCKSCFTHDDVKETDINIIVSSSDNDFCNEPGISFTFDPNTGVITDEDTWMGFNETGFSTISEVIKKTDIQLHYVMGVCYGGCSDECYIIMEFSDGTILEDAEAIDLFIKINKPQTVIDAIPITVTPEHTGPVTLVTAYCPCCFEDTKKKKPVTVKVSSQEEWNFWCYRNCVVFEFDPVTYEILDEEVYDDFEKTNHKSIIDAIKDPNLTLYYKMCDCMGCEDQSTTEFEFSDGVTLYEEDGWNRFVEITK